MPSNGLVLNDKINLEIPEKGLKKFGYFKIIVYICRIKYVNIEQMQLTKAEEQVMKQLWKLNKAFIRDLLNEFPDPRPASTTVLTLLKRMIDKGFVSYKQYGNSREYFPLIKKADYFSDHLKGLIKDFFNNSPAQFASFFANKTEMNAEELTELRDLVDKKIASGKHKT